MFNDLFTIDPTSSSGITWKNSKRKELNGQPAGYAVHRKDKTPKCWALKLNKRTYRVHRVVWEMTYGSISDELEIDHIDGNPFNNKIENLRLVPRITNSRNKRMSIKNKSGITGIFIKEGEYVKASYKNLNGKNIQKNFSIIKLGLTLALAMAKEYREKGISELNQQGAGYSDRHGQGEFK